MDKILTIGIINYNNYPFINVLLNNINNQIKIYPQLLDKINFVLVDDFSDMPLSIEDIPEFISFHQFDKNHGSPSYGRNYIIDNYDSKYIFFIDGDDDLVCDLSELISELEDKEEDLLVSSVVKINKDGQYQKSPFIFNNMLHDPNTPLNIKKKILVHQTGIWSIYKFSFLKNKNIKYLNNIRYEDNYFFYSILLSNPTVNTLDTKYYGWRENFSSFTYDSENYLHRVKLYENVLKKLLMRNLSNEYTPWILFSLWNQTYSNIIRNYENMNLNKSYKYFKELNKITKKNINIINHIKAKNDKEYTDIYYKFSKNKMLNSFLFLFLMQKTKQIIRNKVKYKKNIMKIFTLLPIQKKIFLTSHYGDYSDNPKYLYKELKDKREFNDYRIIYATKNEKMYKNNKDFINYNNRILFYYHLYTSKYYYFNTWLDPLIKKRKKQKWIQLWHGFPYKSMYKDIKTFQSLNKKNDIKAKETNIQKWDEIYSLNYENNIIFERLFPNVKQNMSGYPRINWLIKNKDNNKLKEEIFLKYNLDKNEKYTLYAPTYRPYHLYIEEDEINLLNKSKNKLLFHAHPYLKATNIKGKSNLQIIELLNVDIQEILLIIDELITDYSSIAYDFQKIGGKIKYYTPDFVLYNKFNGLNNEKN